MFHRVVLCRPPAWSPPGCQAQEQPLDNAASLPQAPEPTDARLALGVSGMEQLGYKIVARSKEDRAGHSGAAGEMGTQHCVGWIHGL